MAKHLRSLLQSTVIIVAFGITAHAQPVQLKNIPNESTNFVTIGDFVYFTSGTALWRTDGTAAGTILLKSYLPTTPQGFHEFNGRVFFMVGSAELWRSDGTPSGTIRLTSLTGLRVIGSTSRYLFFRGGAGSATGYELYRTDGTIAGTQMVKDVSPGVGDGYRSFGAVVGDWVFFAGDDETHGTELWKTDGTSAGTVMVRDINPGPGDGFAGGFNAFGYNNRYYFRAQSAETGNEPWISDGTATGTRLLKDIVAGTGSPETIVYAIGHHQSVYFLEVNQTGSSAAVQLWKTSGTPTSTTRLKTIGEPDINHYLHSFRVYKDKVHFLDYEDYFEDVLWATDGTSAGTHSFFRYITMEGSTHYFDEVNDYLLFTGSAQSLPTPLFRSDGTTQGTQEVTRLRSGGFYNGDRYVTRMEITTVNDLAFYADHDGPTDGDTHRPHDSQDYFQLFQTDGTTTQSVRSLHGVSTIGTDNITNFNGKVIFTTRNDQPGSADTQKKLWIYDPAKKTGDPGKIQQELWTGITGTSTSSIPLDSPPTSVADLALFETPSNIGDNYGSRVRGYVIAPETGNYTFWIASDDRGELWLSTSDRAEDKRRIAYVSGWTNSREWGKYASQKSAPVSLVAGRRYYIEALFKEATGRDHLAVGWQRPNGTLERPIPGNRLRPFTGDSNIACAGTGTILIETWTGIDGTRVSAIPVNTPPDLTGERTSFEAPTNVGSNFGSRVRGYVCVPVTGNYTFWIASDDHSELWLSTDADPANKRRIAHVWGWTTPRQWTKYTTQQSAPIALVAGHQYYIEALYKEDEGGDNMAVGWQLPDGTMERPIPGARLSPFDAGGTMALQSESTSQDAALYSEISLYPNPARSSDAQLTLSGYEPIDKPVETEVRIMKMTGEVVFLETIVCGGNCSSYLIDINRSLVPGVYVVELKTDGRRSSQRLLVK